ncbi:cation transporter [Pseudonocardia sp. D17]|uniref:cation transporter n=1 Tax=Pseudonocardia sp. D17 TaxID=882661 RepID=UPI002B3929E7|nr:hypothetical protein PSD17_05530 [Pseudonocardia sp. D17]
MTASLHAPPPRTFAVRIGGMTCAACATRVERGLTKIDGVVATVNYATERARVSCPRETDPQAVLDAIERAGHKARRIDDADPGAGAGDADREARDLRRRLAVAAVLAIPLADSVAVSLFPELRFPGWAWVCLGLAVPLAAWCVWPFHRAAWRGLRHCTASMDTLVSIGVLAATGWSFGLTAVAAAVELARRTHPNNRRNLVWAFGYNTAALPLGAVGLLSPLVPGAAMALSVFVVTHSLSLQGFRPSVLAKPPTGTTPAPPAVGRAAETI